MGQDYKLTSTEATRLEKTLETDPEDVTARERLLVYYAGRPDDASRLSRFRHIEWLIEHHPDSPLLYRDSASFKPADFKPPYEGDLRVIVAAWQQQAEEHKSDVRCSQCRESPLPGQLCPDGGLPEATAPASSRPIPDGSPVRLPLRGRGYFA